MMFLARRVLIAGVLLAMHAHAVAADARFPDWPCVQARVAELSAASVWTGAPLDDVLNSWQGDRQVADLVARVAQRRTPLDEAERAVAAFVHDSPGDKPERARLLVAGLYATLNRERLEVVHGLERLTRRQRDFAKLIESDGAQLRDLQVKPDAEPKELAELTNRVNWGTRIFEERRRSVRFACEVPVVIDQRFFALTRAAQQALQ